MKSIKKVVIAINLNESRPEMFQALKGMDFLNESEIHLVHVLQTTVYALGLGQVPVYPLEKDRQALEESVRLGLENFITGVLPVNFKGKIVNQCLFGEDPKKTFCSHIQEVRPDLVIIAAREKRGLFESSFAQYVNKHTDSNLFIIKSR
ncbi:MAG: universal stress protein [Bacteriovoracaceae bacterium]